MYLLIYLFINVHLYICSMYHLQFHTVIRSSTVHASCIPKLRFTVEFPSGQTWGQPQNPRNPASRKWYPSLATQIHSWRPSTGGYHFAERNLCGGAKLQNDTVYVCCPALHLAVPAPHSIGIPNSEGVGCRSGTPAVHIRPVTSGAFGMGSLPFFGWKVDFTKLTMTILPIWLVFPVVAPEPQGGSLALDPGSTWRASYDIGKWKDY